VESEAADNHPSVALKMMTLGCKLCEPCYFFNRQQNIIALMWLGKTFFLCSRNSKSRWSGYLI